MGFKIWISQGVIILNPTTPKGTQEMALYKIEKYAQLKEISKQTVYNKIKKGELIPQEKNGILYLEYTQLERKRDETTQDLLIQTIRHLKNIEDELKNLKEQNEEILKKIEERTPHQNAEQLGEVKKKGFFK